MSYPHPLAVSAFFTGGFLLFMVILDGIEKWLCFRKLKDLFGTWITLTLIIGFFLMLLYEFLGLMETNKAPVQQPVQPPDKSVENPNPAAPTPIQPPQAPQPDRGQDQPKPQSPQPTNPVNPQPQPGGGGGPSSDYGMPRRVCRYCGLAHGHNCQQGRTGRRR